MEKSYCLNIQTLIECERRTVRMGLAEYFVLLQYVMMAATFIALALVFLELYYGKEEKEES